MTAIQRTCIFTYSLLNSVHSIYGKKGKYHIYPHRCSCSNRFPLPQCKSQNLANSFLQNTFTIKCNFYQDLLRYTLTFLLFLAHLVTKAVHLLFLIVMQTVIICDSLAFVIVVVLCNLITKSLIMLPYSFYSSDWMHGKVGEYFTRVTYEKLNFIT